jgi:16S rRNA (adenine1518-N6/adenine1519-N6)-dimethyltransferase
MQTLTQIKSLLESRGMSPKRSLGQNFLIDHNLIRKLVDEAGVGAGDLVLEVGPGTGTLTEELLARGCEVIAAELDDGLAAMLAERRGEIPGGERLTVVHGDCLADKQTLAPALAGALRRRLAARGSGGMDAGFSLVANLPYGAATPLIMTLLVDWPECRRLAVTIQKEVVDRLMAPARSHDRGALSVVAQATAEIKRVAVLPRECFWPRPEVTSAMVVLARRELPLSADARRLSAGCRVVFAQRRKQLGSVLGRDFPWPEGVLPTMRAEELSVEQAEEISTRLPLAH